MVFDMSDKDNEDKKEHPNAPQGRHSENPPIRRIMVICQKCKNHDIDDNSLIEIDFSRSAMSYVCRQCGFENRVALNPPKSNYPGVGVGVGKR
jgi:hypothetical protein